MKRENIIQVFLLILVSLGMAYLYMFSSNTTFLETKNDAEKEIANIYSTFNQVNQRTDLDLKTISFDELNKLNEDLPFDLFIYENGKLVFWNENKAVPDLNINSLTEEAKLITLKNGYYIALKKTVNGKEFVALSLLRNSYSLVNKYLTNNFSEQFNFEDSDVILPSEHSTGVPVKSPNDLTVFRILHEKNSKETVNQVRLIISISIVFFLYLFMVQFIDALDKKEKFKISFPLSIFFGVLILSLINYFPFEFKKTVVFNSELYASKFYSSLGMLMCHLIVYLSWSYHFMVVILRKKIENNIWTKLFFSFIYFISFIFSSLLLRSLVLDSLINYGPENITLFNYYALFGLFIALMNSIIFVFLSIVFINVNKENKYFTAIVIAMAFVTALTLYLLDFGTMSLGLSLLSLLFTLLVKVQIDLRNSRSIIQVILISLFFSVIQVSSVLRVYTIQKNETAKKTIAFKKSRHRDVTAEDLFSKVEGKILEDAFVKKFFQNPMISYKDIYKRMTFLYFGGYFSKYNVSILPFNIEGKAIKNSSNQSLSDYYDLINKYGESTINENLSFVEDDKNQYSYISLLQINEEEKIVGTLALKISPKTYDLGNVYPELLLEGKNNIITQHYNDFEYAIYANNKLIDQSDEYPYSTILENNGKSTYVQNEYTHSVFQIDENKKIIISNKEENFFSIFSVFSFVLCMYFLIGFVITLAYFKLTNSTNKDVFNFSFRKKINIAMLALVILSFLIIGFATVRYFSTQYSAYHQKSLIRKQKSIYSSIHYVIEKNNLKTAKRFSSFFLNALSSELIEISDIHKMDINIFDLDGSLMVSSQDGIFTSGLLSNVMNPEAYVLLRTENKTMVSQDEKIGNLNYLSIYVPILSEEGEQMAFLNIPYFAQEKNLKDDISDFMKSLVNVYVLLLLIASIVAFFVSNSITNPLKVISEKLKNINFSKTNVPIDWQTEDEIGALVKEYNSMIFQLEESARLLASTERDSAWREMAKQIAHEIKNPLTPMKLSIQHMQRALKDDKERGAELAERVSKTLIEQINNLSDIATAFSSFAKMPKGDRKDIDLIEVVDAAADLFKNDSMELKKNYEVQNATIFADKNQMISVFNNLIKNALQATEELEERKISIDIFVENHFYMIQIKDNGVGIPESKKEKVFVPNFTTKSSGTGLGLAISKQIIEGIRGSIWFESKENEYTIFYVKIPVN